MSLSPEKIRELCAQFSSLHDGALDTSEIAGLEQSLQGDREAMRLYINFARVCAGLDWDMARSFDSAVAGALPLRSLVTTKESRSTVLDFVKSTSRWGRNLLRRPAALSVAAIVLVAIGVAVAVSVVPLPWATEHATPARAVARLARTIDCKWKLGTPIVQPGDELRIGQTLELMDGRAEIEFFGGAVVTLEGPAVLTMRSEQEWALERGRLAARLPVGHSGFNLTTPAVNVAKCSSEFTVEVDEKKRVEVRVIKGQMEASSNHSQKNKPIQLSAGMSARFDPSQTIPQTHVAEEPISPELARWREYRDALRDREDLVGYYVFEQVGNDSALPNVARQGVGGIGSINGALWTDGRFPGKRALEFGDRRHVMLGLKYKQLAPPFTIAAWVCPREVSVSQRIFSSPPTFQPQGFGFGLTPDGLQLTAWSGKNYDAPATLVTGEWTHVAVTVNDDGKTAFYQDGKEIGSDTIVPPLAPAEDEFFIGSYGHREFFQGKIDELAVFNRIFAAEEIQELASAARP